MEGLPVPNPIKVAVLGFWHVHAAEYADRVRRHPDTELVAVWDDDRGRGRAAAEDLDTAFSTTSAIYSPATTSMPLPLPPPPVSITES
jgi:predicted dehydrogenase